MEKILGNNKPEKNFVIKVPIEDTLVNQDLLEMRNKDMILNVLFGRAICERLYDTFKNEFYDANGNVEQFNDLVRVFNTLKIEDRKKVLSWPRELIGKKMENIIQQMSGGQTAEDVTNNLLNIADKYGYTLGYHMSDIDINHKSESNEWNINGKELDDRDNMLMAYYSLDYENLYKKKPASFLYIVRAELGKNTAHKRDESNNWGRANKLSIIEKVEVAPIINQIHQEYNERYIEQSEDRMAA